MAHPRSGFAAPPRGGAPSGREAPVRGVRWMRLPLTSPVPIGTLENRVEPK